ncbi:MAG TPA: sulfotransferase family protein, partial [Roseovarius sp.]|nr:sulfotransferase family protein [Roseovarius sp.]
DHPMRDAILAAQPQNPTAVIEQLLGPVPAQKAHFYQKHMAQHMIPGIPRDWVPGVVNLFLIRHPARVAASFSAKYDNP